MDPSERFRSPSARRSSHCERSARVKPDPIPDDDLRDILTATIQAPNGGNAQPWQFLAVRDPELRRQLGELYREAWWAKRADQGIHGRRTSTNRAGRWSRR